MNRIDIAMANGLIDNALDSIRLLQQETPGFALYETVELCLKDLKMRLKEETLDASDIRANPLWRLAARELEEVPRPLAACLAKQIYEIREAIDSIN